MAAVGERAAVRRLVERLGFGARPGELDTAVGRGFGPVRDELLAAVGDPGAVAAPAVGDERNRDEQVAIALWWLERMVTSGVSITERVTWFWHGHFATSVQKVRSARLMVRQNETLRGKGLGDFAELVRAMVVDPAMLIWLDGQKNTAKAANENLARELMELFTLGVGNYSEQDVREAARALTGWKVNRDTMSAGLNPRQQDKGAKTVLGRSGALDAGSLVDVLVGQPVSARFVVQRLWFRFVGAKPPEDDVVGRLVGAYGADRNVARVLRAITEEPGFRDERNTLVKQPVEWAVGLMRACKVRPSALPEGDRNKLIAGLRGMGQVPFLPPSVGGWPAGAAWLTTSAALARLHVAQLITAPGELTALKGSDPVGAVGALLGVDGWSERTRNALAKVAKQPGQLVAVAATAPEYVVSG
jgi:uncharacterized protein (DUF1800 family)